MEDRYACVGEDRILARDNGAGAALDGIGGKSRAIGFHTLQSCEKKTAFDLAGVRRDTGDLHLTDIAGGQFLEKCDFLQFHGHTKSRFSCARNAAKAVLCESVVFVGNHCWRHFLLKIGPAA